MPTKKRKNIDLPAEDGPGNKEETAPRQLATLPLAFQSGIPDEDHPAARELCELSFKELLPKNFFVIVYGVRRTGKTHAVSVLLEEMKNEFDFAYLFSETAGLHKGQAGELDFEMIRPEAKFEGYDEEALTRIMERQRRVLEHNNACERKRDRKPNRTLLIFDDFVHNPKIRYSQIFTELPVLGRHYELSVICLTQGYSSVASGGLNKATRQNADLVMTFLPRNQVDMEHISEWYLTKNKKEGIWLTKSICQHKHQLMAIDLSQPHLVEFEDYVYVYKAPEQVPKYELGKIQWDLAREEAKRQRQLTLDAKLTDAQSFYFGSEGQIKQSQINQGVGRHLQEKTKKSGPVSLFHAFQALQVPQ